MEVMAPQPAEPSGHCFGLPRGCPTELARRQAQERPGGQRPARADGCTWLRRAQPWIGASAGTGVPAACGAGPGLQPLPPAQMGAPPPLQPPTLSPRPRHPPVGDEAGFSLISSSPVPRPAVRRSAHRRPSWLWLTLPGGKGSCHQAFSVPGPAAASVDSPGATRVARGQGRGETQAARARGWAARRARATHRRPQGARRRGRRRPLSAAGAPAAERPTQAPGRRRRAARGSGAPGRRHSPRGSCRGALQTERRVRRGVRGRAGQGEARGAGGPSGVTYRGPQSGRRTQAAPAGSEPSFPGCPPSPASSSQSSATGHQGEGRRDGESGQIPGRLPGAPDPQLQTPARSGQQLGARKGRLPGTSAPCARPARAPRGAPSQVPGVEATSPPAHPLTPRAGPTPAPSPALTSRPSSGRMSARSCRRLSLMRARRRFSSSGFRLCGARRPR